MARMLVGRVHQLISWREHIKSLEPPLAERIGTVPGDSCPPTSAGVRVSMAMANSPSRSMEKPGTLQL